ncbi:MAG: transposase [Rhodanobacteraceae bacterium]|nr:transposase [Rhodanobacteraceae bacterium]
MRSEVVPQGALGKALTYLQAHWQKLSRFVENPAWPIDNNRCENAIRPFVIGRKKFLFADTPAGAHASAALYSLIETAKANGHEPYSYLCHVFTHLPRAQSLTDFEALLPWHVSATDPSRAIDA